MGAVSEMDLPKSPREAMELDRWYFCGIDAMLAADRKAIGGDSQTIRAQAADLGRPDGNATVWPLAARTLWKQASGCLTASRPCKAELKLNL